MKKNRLIWGLMITLPLVIGGLGCKKFLDRKPLTSTLDDLNQGKVEASVFGLYSILRDYGGFSSLPWVDFQSIRDDDAQKGSDENDGREIVAEFETFQYSKDDWAPNTYWNDHYFLANQATNAIAYAEGATDPATLRNIGEASFFRAYCYFELVKTYGEIPIIRNQIVKTADAIQPKSTIDEVYAFIDEDLERAAQYLPLSSTEYGSNFVGRLTKGAANTMWAQTHLFRGNWARVTALCNEVIASGQYSLPEFSKIWEDGINYAGKNGPESIWEMQAYCGPNAATGGAINYWSYWGTCQGVRQGGTTIEWNLGWGWNTPTDKLESQWPESDPRKRKTILYSGQFDGGPAQGGFGATLPAYTNPSGTGGFSQKYWNKKVYSDPAMRAYTGYIDGNGGAYWINHRILRYADVYLMLAEASNELGDGATAAASLEKVRDRASGFLGAGRTVVPYIPFTTQEAMRTAIKNERRWEFAMEGYRFYDLVRWGDAQNELGSLGYTPRCKYYPIPQKAIDVSNGVLVQNPEW
ncbi:MAG TPA: RagB/SusD family nutrient uptake outer membrane protein [Ferruginibacter sp.]|nr:RagB/SusD family nutrient uptake outer membrane protein [Ferruginibacter sp.]HPH89727.1 RagB/SusD family nutrient uptake outer membrane protein [Ferruginibacter sp.]